MVTTNNTHTVTIEHLGQERFQTVEDDPFPEPSEAGPYLTHDPVKTTFVYDASEYQFDPSQGFEGAAVQHGADLGWLLAVQQRRSHAERNCPFPLATRRSGRSERGACGLTRITTLGRT